MDTEELLRQAALFFDIGSVKSIQPIERALANQNFFIEADRGEYVLRILRTQKPEGLVAEYAIEEQLEKAGILAPHLMAGADGELSCNIGGKTITCTKRIAGERPAHATPDLAQQIGKTLALFQQAVTEVPGYAYFWLKKEAAHKEMTRFEKSDLTTRIAARITEHEDIFEMDLPKGFVHGDLHLGNLIVTKDDTLAIFDFESTERDILLLDLGVSALSFYNIGTIADEAPLRSLFKGYESIRPLTALEKKNFKKAAMYLSAAAAAWVYNEGYPAYAEGSLNAGDIISRLDI